MSTLAEELEATWTPLHPGVTVPPLQNTTAPEPSGLAAELEATWTPPAELPGGDTQAWHALGRPQTVRGEIGANVSDALNWIRENPQTILDMLLQGAGTAGGIAAGAPLGPLGATAGGAGGNVLGKQISRRAGQALGLPDAEPPPDLVSAETVVDAGLGALGPASSTVARTGSRVLTGLDRGAFMRKHGEAVDDIGDMGIAARRLVMATLTPDETAMLAGLRVPPRLSEVTNTQRVALRELLDSSIEGARANATRTHLTGGLGGAGIGAAVALEPVTGALLGAGLSQAAVGGARVLLDSPRFGQRFAQWALDVDRNRRAETARSLAAIYAGQQLTGQERAAFNTIQSELSGDRRAVTVDRLGRPHDSRGRFTAIDYRGHPLVRPDDDAEGDQ